MRGNGINSKWKKCKRIVGKIEKKSVGNRKEHDQEQRREKKKKKKDAENDKKEGNLREN